MDLEELATAADDEGTENVVAREGLEWKSDEPRAWRGGMIDGSHDATSQKVALWSAVRRCW